MLIPITKHDSLRGCAIAVDAMHGRAMGMAVDQSLHAVQAQRRAYRFVVDVGDGVVD